MPTNYSDTQTKLLNQVGAVSSAADWSIEFPLIVDRAEQRMYRDLDLLGTRVTDTGLTSSGVRTFPLPTTFGTFLVVEGINVISSSGNRTVVVPVSRPFIDMTFPN